MDKWKDIELEKMKVGGNSKAKAFFKSQPDYRTDMSIHDKYNSKAAALYRDKISTLADGRSWSEETSTARNWEPPLPRSSSSTAVGRMSNGSSSISHSASSPELMLGISKSELNSQKEDFFSRKQMENASRPDNLPPSQGGRYTGFGSGPVAATNSSGWDTAFSSLSSGWSSFAAGAAQFATVASQQAVKLGSTVNESVIKPTATKAAELGTTMNEGVKKVSTRVQEGKLLDDVSASMSTLSSKVRDASSKGWTNLQSASAKGWSNIQTLVNQNSSGDYGTKSLTSGANSGGGYGAVNGESPFNNVTSHGDGNWDWDSYTDISGEEVNDDEGINGKATTEGGGTDDNGDSWAWGSDSESPKQKSPPKNGASQSAKQSSARTTTRTPPKTDAVASNDGWGDLINWDNDEWGESSGWSNEDWSSPDSKSKISAGGNGGKKAD